MKPPIDQTPEEKAAKIKELKERINKITETANAVILLQELEKYGKRKRTEDDKEHCK